MTEKVGLSSRQLERVAGVPHSESGVPLLIWLSAFPQLKGWVGPPTSVIPHRKDPHRQTPRIVSPRGF